MEQTLDFNSQIQVRREKLAKIRKQGVAFPNDFRRDSYAKDLHNKFDSFDKEQLKNNPTIVKVAGRVVLSRLMGKAMFITIFDSSDKIQLYVARDNLQEGQYANFTDLLDLGDTVVASGELFKTNTGELSIRCDFVQIVTKALRPLPDKHQGLKDQETRYRQRYLDLIANENTRQIFTLRSKLVTSLRKFFIERNFLEVETPMLHPIPGGATARPFVTFHNALSQNMYLRIAPELYLKRLVVGGIDRVFELNRNFRNEGVSVRHNPEFTMLEYYQAYADYVDLMDQTEILFKQLAIDVLGTTKVVYGDYEFDFSKPFLRITMHEAIVKYSKGIKLEDLHNFETAKQIAKDLKIEIQPSWGLGSIVNAIFEEVAEPNLIEPTFLTSHPAEISPLARRNDINPEITDRFELFIAGREISNGFSELNDAEDQANRFKEQVSAKEKGDAEAMYYDEDYVTALEYGLPPTAGQGIGVDRLVMLFANAQSIRDVILFPALRNLEQN